jgi:RNA polymerase sigma-70 factor (ECF subfamily)
MPLPGWLYFLIQFVMSTRQECDLMLIEQMKQGKQIAYAAIMGHYTKSLYNMLYLMVKDVTEAEDLTVEAFAKAFINIEFYQPTHNFSTWLFKVAKNHALDHIKKNKHKPKNYEGLDYIRNTMQDSGPDPAELYVQQQQIQHIVKLIERLRPRYRAVIEMKCLEDLSYEEMAARLNTSKAMVRSYLFRAKKILKTDLDNV